MFNIFKKKQSQVNYNRFVTCYLVCSKHDQLQFNTEHKIANSSGRRALFLQEQCARDFIKERYDRQLVIMVLNIPEHMVELFPNNTTFCECHEPIDIDACYVQTIYP